MLGTKRRAVGIYIRARTGASACAATIGLRCNNTMMTVTHTENAARNSVLVVTHGPTPCGAATFERQGTDTHYEYY